MENNKNKKSVKFQGDMLNFCDFIQVFVFTRNHHLKRNSFASTFKSKLHLLLVYPSTWYICDLSLFHIETEGKDRWIIGGGGGGGGKGYVPPPLSNYWGGGFLLHLCFTLYALYTVDTTTY